MKSLLEVQKKLLSFKKNWLNPHFKSKYLTLDNLLEWLLPICNDLWILITHTMKDWILTTKVSDDKETITSEFPIWGESNPQKIWSLLTYWKRYNIGLIFNVTTEEDDDWNKASQVKENHKPIPEKERVKFENKHYDKFIQEYKKHLEKYPNAESMIKMLDVQYILNEEYKNKIVEFYKTIK